MQVTIDNQKGLVSEIKLNNANIIFPWSIEFGDTKSFFSLEQPGWHNNKSNVELDFSNDFLKGSMNVEMTDGSFELNWEEAIDEDKNLIRRKSTITALKDSYLMDFVQQFRFKENAFQKGLIANKEVLHKSSNKYHQFETHKAELKGDEMNCVIESKVLENPGSFRQEMYIRDRKDMWIVHSRLMPTKDDKLMIKLNVKWYNKALPQMIGNFLLKFKPLRNYMWYRGERDPYKPWNLPFRFLKPSAYRLSKLKKGETLTIETEFKLS